MKKLVLLILTIFLTMPAGATTLTGGVTYTVESARKEAFAIKYNNGHLRTMVRNA